MNVKCRTSFFTICMWLLTFSMQAHAQQTQTNESIKEELQPPHTEEQMQEDDAAHKDILNDQLAPLNLEIEMGYTLIFQMASDVEDDSNSLLSGSYDLGITWSPIQTGSLSIGIEGGQILSHNDDEDLGANVGSIMGINDDLDNLAIVLSGLAWTQSFYNDALVINIGKIQMSDFFDANEVANDETTQFLSTALVNNLTIPFPDDGLGINLWANLSENVYATFGMADNNAVGTYSPFKTVDEGDFFYAAELGYIHTGKHPGNYRLTVWHAQTPADDGNGIAISIDQHLTDNLVVFGRWGMGDEKIGDFEQFVSAGLGIESPFGRAGDLFAVGFAWANPSDITVDEETIVEAFYRYQLNDKMELTPSIQAVINPAASTDSATVYVAALRLQMTW